MHVTNRRSFLQETLAVAGVAAVAAMPGTLRAAAPAAPAAATQPSGPHKPLLATDVIEFGPQKLKLSRMAIGTGTYGAGHSSNQLRKHGAEGVAELLVLAYEKGIFFWDTSDSYGTHPAIKIALKKVPREKVTIVTKSPAVSGENLKADLARFLQEMGTEYIDMVLLHSRMRADWETLDKPMMDVLSEAKEKKTVRSAGISIHSIDAMKAAAKSKWLDVCMVRINPVGIRMDAMPAQVLPVMEELKAAGKGMIGIKVLGEGQMRSRLDDAINFALYKSPAQCFSIGCESREDLIDNIARIEKLGKEPPKA